MEDGTTMPRNPKVINLDTSAKEENPRQPNQIEPKDSFFLIDFNTGFLWLSDSRKKATILDFLKNKFKSINFVSKDVYDEKQFIDTIKTLDSIKLSIVPNLFAPTNTLSEKLVDEINGYGATTAVLQLQYKDKFVGNDLAAKIDSLFKDKTNFSGITISGRDAKNLGILFNINSFSRKIDFKSSIDENGLFNPDNVFSQLIYHIEHEN